MPGASNKGFAGSAVPSIDVRDTDKEIEVVAELPGMRSRNVEVGALERCSHYPRCQRHQAGDAGEGLRSARAELGCSNEDVPLQRGCKSQRRKAEFKKGVLAVTIPKTDEARSAVKRIRVTQG